MYPKFSFHQIPFRINWVQKSMSTYPIYTESSNFFEDNPGI